jgi:hypothetical protein
MNSVRVSGYKTLVGALTDRLAAKCILRDRVIHIRTAVKENIVEFCTGVDRFSPFSTIFVGNHMPLITGTI